MFEADGSALLRGLATTDALARVFSDASYLEAMLRFEVALAAAEAESGVVPAPVAEAVARAADPDAFDVAALVQGARATGTVAIPFVDQLKTMVARHAPDARPFVHYGATSQDVTDTALALCLAKARQALADDHHALLAALRDLSTAHADTVMLARTLLQPAAPTTFGLKVAGWFGAADRAGQSLFSAFDEARMLQFGGPAGTLALLGKEGPAVLERLAARLSLRVPPAPWHTHRDILAVLVSACGVYVGALGKIARDISLLMQFEVAEAAERGNGSSSMPHKQNPAGCAVALAAATRMPGLVATYLASMTQEHERGVGNWHAESATVPDVIQTTGAALRAVRGAVEGLRVDPAKMRAHLDATGGTILAERALAIVSSHLGAEAARAAVDGALQAVREKKTQFVDALTAHDAIRGRLSPEELDALREPVSYIGSAEHFRQRLLNENKR